MKVLTIVGKTTFISLATIFIASCGGGNSENESGSSVLTGVFKDSTIEGVSYTTLTQSGVTDSAGRFQYLVNEKVNFSIGALFFPSVDGASLITPVELGSDASNSTDATINIARLLQSIDVDGNPDNGITVAQSAATNASAINFDQSTSSFEQDIVVINFVANSGSATTDLVSTDEALAHMNASLGTNISSSDQTSEVVTSGRILTLSQFTATIVGKNLVLRDDNGLRDDTAILVANSNNTVTGSFQGATVNLSWYWDNDTYCRSGTSGTQTIELECQIVTVDNGVATFLGNVERSYFIE